MGFQKATKKQAKARIGIIGPSGSGKTYTALKIASGLGGKIAVIDTEHGSASKYADEFEFDVLELDTYHPQKYIDGIIEAGKAGYDVLIIDSLSHAWAGTEGALELVEKNAAKYGGNKFAAWRDVTPLHNKLVQSILSAPMHVIATMRTKVSYIQTQDEKGRTIIKKVGTEPIQREGMEYEFDIVAEMDLDHNFIVTKTRCKALDGLIVNKPDQTISKTILDWLTDGAVVTPPQQKPDENSIATDAQRKKIYYLANKLGFSSDNMHAIMKERYNKESSKQLSKDEASDLIEYLTEIEKHASAGDENVGS